MQFGFRTRTWAELQFGVLGRDMIFAIPIFKEDASPFMTLFPVDLILAGSPGVPTSDWPEDEGGSEIDAMLCLVNTIASVRDCGWRIQ